MNHEQIIQALKDLTEWKGYPTTTRELAADLDRETESVHAILVDMEVKGLVKRVDSVTWQVVEKHDY